MKKLIDPKLIIIKNDAFETIGIDIISNQFRLYTWGIPSGTGLPVWQKEIRMKADNKVLLQLVELNEAFNKENTTEKKKHFIALEISSLIKENY